MKNGPKKSIRFLVLVAVLALLWSLGIFLNIDLTVLGNKLATLPLIISGPVFIAFYVTVTFFIWLSKDAFRIAAAIVFGAYWSTLFIWIGECVNAVILFNGARYLGKDFVEGAMRRRGLYEKISRVNFFWLFVFRAAPLLPFRFMDIGCGLTGMSFRRYFTAVVIGSPLRIFWVQFILAGAGTAVLKDPYALSRYLTANRTALLISLVYLVMVVVAVLKMRDKKWR